MSDTGATATRERPKPLASGAVAATIASLLFVVSGYIVNVVLGRALGPVDYGLFGVVIGLMTVINALQTSGVPQAIAKFAAEKRYEPSYLLLTGGLIQLGSAVVLAVGLFLLAEPLAVLLRDPDLTLPIRLAAFAIPSYALFTLVSGIEGGRGRYVRQALMLSVFSIAKAVVAVVLGLAFALLGAIVGYIVAPLIGVLASRERPALGSAHLISARPILAYSIPLLLLAALSIGYLNVDLFVVKSLMTDPASAGYYTAAQNIARVPYYLAAGLATILLPAIARVFEDDLRRAQMTVREALRFGFIVILPAAVLIVATSQEAVALLYGQTYEPADLPLRLLAAAMAGFAFFSLLTSLLAGIGRTWNAVLAAAIGLVASTVTGVLLVPASGMDGAAIGTLVGAMAALIISAVATQRALPFEFPWMALVRTGVASGVVGLLATLLHGTGAVVIGLPILGLIYLALLAVMRELTRQDWIRLRGILPTRSAAT